MRTVAATIEAKHRREYERYRDYSIAQMKRDEITAAGEFLNTFTYSEIPYERDARGLYLVDEDGTNIYLSDISDSSAIKYNLIADKDPQMSWQAERVRLENKHIRFADTMPAGSTYIVVSDFPEHEIDKLGRDVFGYRRARQTGFLQLFHADTNGKVTIYGHSFDQNNHGGIQAMYRMFGKQRDEKQ